MAVKIIASFGLLMQKASALGKAKKSGDAKAIEIAQKDFDAYFEICKQSDEILS